jgi:hypothetical protein
MGWLKNKVRHKKKNINNILRPINMDAILQIYSLSNSTQEKLFKNGFIVLSEHEYNYLSGCYFDLFQKEEISVFITTDALLHIFHTMQDDLIKNVEYDYLYNLTKQLLIQLQYECINTYESIDNVHPIIKESMRRNVEYFTVALLLLKDNTDIPICVEENVKNFVQRILEHTIIETYPGEDYTQYKPRGHYEGNKRLEKYFRCLRWLSRRIFLIEDEDHPELARYDITQAVAISQIFKENPKTMELWETIYKITSFLAGVADSITPPLVQKAITNVFGEGFTIEMLESFNNIIALRNEFSKPEYPESQIVTVPQSYPGQMPNKYIQFMGERYAIDSDVFSQTTSPTVPFRLLPKGLDVVATVLNSDRALVHLSDEIEKFPQLEAQIDNQRSRFAGIPEPDWTKSIYNNWLFVLKSLTAIFGDPYPKFMRKTAWYDEKLNTMLASWTQLRHDYILYGEQTVVPAPIAIGYGYVEPIPEFYERLAHLSEKIRTTLSDFDIVSEGYDSSFKTFEGWLNTFGAYAEKELINEPLTPDEQNYIKRFGVELFSFFSGYAGGPKEQNPMLVADVCTDSNTGSILHESVGKFNPIIVIYEEPNGTVRAGIGYIMSYYEFIKPDYNRITDSEWEAMVESNQIPNRPGWTNNFLDQSQ